MVGGQSDPALLAWIIVEARCDPGFGAMRLLALMFSSLSVCSRSLALTLSDLVARNVRGQGSSIQYEPFESKNNQPYDASHRGVSNILSFT
jgi:hypothetical protein